MVKCILWLIKKKTNIRHQKALFCIVDKQNPFAKQSVQHSQYLTTQSIAKFMIYVRFKNLPKECNTNVLFIDLGRSYGNTSFIIAQIKVWCHDGFRQCVNHFITG